MHGHSLSRMWAGLVGLRTPASASRRPKNQWSLKLVLCHPDKLSGCLAEKFKHCREMVNSSSSSPWGTARRRTRKSSAQPSQLSWSWRRCPYSMKLISIRYSIQLQSFSSMAAIRVKGRLELRTQAGSNSRTKLGFTKRRTSTSHWLKITRPYPFQLWLSLKK